MCGSRLHRSAVLLCVCSLLGLGGPPGTLQGIWKQPVPKEGMGSQLQGHLCLQSHFFPAVRR